MSIHAALLRILLSLALVLNGLGAAAASVQMPGHMEHLMAKVAGMSHESDHASCDHHHPVAAASAHPGSHQLHPDHGDPVSPDCCKSSTCSCACVHACTSVTMASLQVLPIPTHDPGVGRMTVTHPSPALPHLIRPPIG